MDISTEIDIQFGIQLKDDTISILIKLLSVPTVDDDLQSDIIPNIGRHYSWTIMDDLKSGRIRVVRYRPNSISNYGEFKSILNTRGVQTITVTVEGIWVTIATPKTKKNK
jgi:hypothetical protein